MSTRRARRMHARRVWVLAALVALASMTFADPSYAEPTAREHFAQGVEASRRGDLVVALEHFEKAHALAPNQTVLFNLGQTYSALARPVEALNAFERYLKMDNPPGDAGRRREVEALIRKNEGRVGLLEVELEPPDAALQIDGQPVSTVAGAKTRVAAGRRLVTATRDGYRPAVHAVEVRPSETTRLRVALERPSVAPDSFIEARCAVPDVTVSVDGVVVGGSLRALLVPVASGAHRVRFERRGFVPWEAAVVAGRKSVARVECALAHDLSLPVSDRAELRVLVSESRATIRVNGMPFRGERLPPGPHAVEVVAPGFQSWKDQVNLRAGVRNELRVTLEPTAERRREERSRTRSIVAFSAGGVGVALGAVAAILYVSNQSRYDDWRRDQQAFSRELSTGEPSPGQARRAEDLQERAASIQRTDDLALGAGVLGGVFVAVSAALLLSDGDADARASQERAAYPLRFAW
jgi:hypothetical protein